VSTGLALAVTVWFAPALAHSVGPARSATPESGLFEGIEMVEAATLHTQTLEDAALGITTISAQDIRKYGFRTLGAAVDVYPDFRRVGLKTGEDARQMPAGRAIRLGEGQRKLKLAVNQSALRRLGLRYAPAATGEEDFLVLQ
jgi:hypothetical protein